MAYDYLIESVNGQSFDLLPRTDDEYGLVAAVTSKRLPGLLAETGLKHSSVAQYASHLALEGAVDREFLFSGGQTIVNELNVLAEGIKRIEAEEESGFLMRAELPEDEEIWSALRGHAGLAILDRSGYTEHTLSPFEISEPGTLQQSFIHPTPVRESLPGIVQTIHAITALRDNPRATHYMEQYAITRDGQGKPTHVSDQGHLMVGWLNRIGEFIPYTKISF